MDAIHKVFSKNSLQTTKIPVVPSSNHIIKEQSKQRRKDSFTVSDSLTQDVDWITVVNQELETLAKEFPEIGFYIKEEDAVESLIQIAEGLGEGTHLVISHKWLRQLARNSKELEKGIGILRKIATQLSANSSQFPASGAEITEQGVTFWTGEEKNKDNGCSNPYNNYKSFLEQMNQSSSTMPRSSLDSKIKSSISTYTVAGLYSRLAGASSKQQARAAISEVHRNIGSLQLVSALGDTKERSKARASIASLRKLLLRGSRKIQKLSAEEITQLLEKRAIKQKEEERALALQIERKKQQSKRKSADSSIANEGQLEDLHNAYRHHSRKYNHYMPSPSLPPSSVPTISGSDLGASGGVDTTLAIQISPTISLSDL